MATLKKKIDEQLEQLAQRFLTYLKHCLSQDGVAFRDDMVILFGKWLLAKSKRVTRYEQGDMRLVDQFLDFAWPCIVDPSKSLPEEAPEPKKVVPHAALGGRAQGAIDWAAFYNQVNAPNQAVRIDNIPVADGRVRVEWDPEVADWHILNQ